LRAGLPVARCGANGLKTRERQTSLTGEKAPDAEEQEKRKKDKAKAKDGLGKAEEVLLPLLQESAAKKPENLAVILGDDLDGHAKVAGRLYSQVQLVRNRNLLSKAQGIQRAMAAEFKQEGRRGADRLETDPCPREEGLSDHLPSG